MEQSRLDRINELASEAKRRTLTAEELEERARLRQEYLAEWRKNTIDVLEHTYVQTPDGVKHKLHKKGEISQK